MSIFIEEDILNLLQEQKSMLIKLENKVDKIAADLRKTENMNKKNADLSINTLKLQKVDKEEVDILRQKVNETNAAVRCIQNRTEDTFFDLQNLVEYANEHWGYQR